MTPKESKLRQLRISLAIAVTICLLSLLLALASVFGAVTWVPARFGIPIAIGTFGIAGSNLLYISRLRR